MLYTLLRAALFRLDAETSHNLTLPLINRCLGNTLLRPLLARRNARYNVPFTCMGLTFPNRIGLAAGLDKNADYLDGLGALGFGFIEVGTVTPRPQPGNPKPRLFRLTDEHAIINRLGFNNLGVDHLVRQVKDRHYKGVLGINIGKNADTPLEQANDDYIHCLRKVYAYADYVTVNISSPNTPGLRDLQHGSMLRDLFGSLKEVQRELHNKHGRYTPIAVKIAPDMSDAEIDEFAEQALAFEIDGVIATNTTFSRIGVEQSTHAAETGGLSGRPLTTRSTATIRKLGTRFADRIPIIGVGGISTASDGSEKLDAGAQLLQIYTGLIYQGPSLISALVKATARRT
ncbi:MAG: quinone-dependent dihydroorotate dehydrogenase [Granulosicoccus sp.]|nr:quinone-dependent dihydroorotate dehydrogenase [Granulosicoccus sp.]